MCLKTVTKTFKHDNTLSLGRWKKGYKVFESGHDGSLFGPFMYNLVAMGKTYVDMRSANIRADEEDCLGNRKEYVTGFHILTSLKEAIALADILGGIVVQVSYNGVVAEGTESRTSSHKPYKVVVARVMKLVRKVKV